MYRLKAQEVKKEALLSSESDPNIFSYGERSGTEIVTWKVPEALSRELPAYSQM